MRIRAGCQITYDCPQPTPMLLMIHPHPSRDADLVGPHRLSFDPPIPSRHYLDDFGNVCTRIVAPPGRLTFATSLLMRDTGLPDRVLPEARQHPVENLPDQVLLYLLGSRYCDTDKLTAFAWAHFGHVPEGWARVQAVCDFAHSHITFDYQRASATRSAAEAHRDQAGVCRDFAHLAVTLCRCLNIPARYCTGYLGDIGITPLDDPMDFAAWFEAYLDGAWHTFDARHNTPRIGRIVMARGRDATDVAITTTFGPCTLAGFEVVTEEVTA